MIKRLPLYAAFVLLVGCKKPMDYVPDPDLTVGLTGAYQLSYYQNGNQILNLPTKTISAVFEVSKVDLTHLKAQLTFDFNSFTSVASTNVVELKRNDRDPSLYMMFKSGRNVGTITASTMEINDISADSLVTRITAKR